MRQTSEAFPFGRRFAGPIRRAWHPHPAVEPTYTRDAVSTRGRRLHECARARATLARSSTGESGAGSREGEARLSAIEEQLATLNRQLAELRETLPGSSSPLPRGQERLRVDDPPGDGPNGGGGERRTLRSA